jgi:aldehyde:ferredoxin oxidoreductase
MISPEILGLPEKLDPYAVKDKPRWTIILQDLTSAINSSVVCLFSSFALGLPRVCRDAGSYYRF